jgi:hypothetical protein
MMVSRQRRHPSCRMHPQKKRQAFLMSEHREVVTIDELTAQG